MGLPHLVAALSGSRAYRGELVSHGRNYHNAAENRPVDRNHVRRVIAYCEYVDTDEGRDFYHNAELRGAIWYLCDQYA